MLSLTAGALPHKKRALQGRRFIVVDIENVVGGAVKTIEQAVAAQLVIDDAIRLGSDEMVVVGVSHVGLFSTRRSWGSARLLVQSGPDGADIQLLSVLENESIEQRFDEVVLVSGDGIFTDSVARLGAAGVGVTVVSRPEALSRRLQMAAKNTVFLGDDDHLLMDATTTAPTLAVAGGVG